MATTGRGKDRGKARREPNRRATRGRAPAPAPTVRAEHQPLIAKTREALRSGVPLALAELSSAMIEAAAPAPGTSEQPSLTEMMESLIGVSLAETTALLHGIGALCTDDLLALRIRRELATRPHPVPEDVSGLVDLTATDAVAMDDGSGVAENLVVQLSGAGVQGSSLVILVDHALGSIVKDAFIAHRPLPELVEQLTEAARADRVVPRFVPVPLAGLRARLEGAIAAYETVGDALAPREAWPGLKPLVLHIARSLPTGGAGYPPSAMDPAEIVEGLLLEEDVDAADAIAHDFLDSPYAAGIRGDADLVHELAHLYGMIAYDQSDTEDGAWLAPFVTWLVSGPLPSLLSGDPDQYALAPTVLRAFIRFWHDNAGLDQEETEAAVDAVDAAEPDFLRRRDDPEVVAERREFLPARGAGLPLGPTSRSSGARARTRKPRPRSRGSSAEPTT